MYKGYYRNFSRFFNYIYIRNHVLIACNSKLVTLTWPLTFAFQSSFRYMIYNSHDIYSIKYFQSLNSCHCSLNPVYKRKKSWWLYCLVKVRGSVGFEQRSQTVSYSANFALKTDKFWPLMHYTKVFLKKILKIGKF